MSSSIPVELIAPDGYYKYLGVEKPVDEDAVKKAYRKLSLKHHPDKGGDADTFRLLNRAQKVLLDEKLRAQYDTLGIDLDDETEGADNEDGDAHEQGTAQGIVHEMASMALTGLVQLCVRTRTL